MMRMLGFMLMVIEKVRWLYMFEEYVCIGMFMKLFSLVNLVILLYLWVIWLWFRLVVRLLSTMFWCLVRDVLKFILRVSSVFIWLWMLMWFWVGGRILVIVCIRVDLLVLLVLMMFSIVFWGMLKVMFFRVWILWIECC